jgi:hypothetical protein
MGGVDRQVAAVGRGTVSGRMQGRDGCRWMLMGIIAFCPSGHRVKVKDEFAGRKGVCPECQARFRIPLQSCPLPTARVLGLDAAWAASLTRAVILPADHAYLKSEPPKGKHPSPPKGTHPSSTSASSSAPRLAPPPAPRRQTEPQSPALHPMLAADPDADWCIAIHGGEPSVPLTAAEMQAWLGSGRATGAELVWRSDWADWVSIRNVFPELVPGP